MRAEVRVERNSCALSKERMKSGGKKGAKTQRKKLCAHKEGKRAHKANKETAEREREIESGRSRAEEGKK